MPSAILPYTARLINAGEAASPLSAQNTFDTHYPVQLTDGSWLEIPLCALPGNRQAIALLMSNQCALAVTDHLSMLMADLARALEPECIAAIPTMGLEYASRVAQQLGMPHYTAMGFSRKFWYSDTLREPVTSFTSPDQHKYLYLDPALLDRVQGKRVVIVDDVINTGASSLAAAQLLKRAGAQVTGLIVALTEGYAWQKSLAEAFNSTQSAIRSIGHIPLFVRQNNAWAAQAGT